MTPILFSIDEKKMSIAAEYCAQERGYNNIFSLPVLIIGTCVPEKILE
jgi:hypothetical protein